MEISSAYRAYQILRTKLLSDVEEFWVLALSSCLRVKECRMIFRGTADSCQVHPRDIFRFAYCANASRLILAHNHPSGELEPSESDLLVTNKLISIGYLMEVPIVDHLILTEFGFRSMAEHGDCNFSYSQRCTTSQSVLPDTLRASQSLPD